MAHQWIPFCTTTPLQVAVANCFQYAMSSSYMDDLNNLMHGNMKKLLSGLEPHFECCEPQGGYFIMSTPKDKLKGKLGITPNSSDFEVARDLIRNNLIGSIPLTAFYTVDSPKVTWLRWAYCKRPELINQGLEKLDNL
jgi:N-succinyldiaminopimelate aminotransferase